MHNKKSPVNNIISGICRMFIFVNQENLCAKNELLIKIKPKRFFSTFLMPNFKLNYIKKNESRRCVLESRKILDNFQELINEIEIIMQLKTFRINF